LTIYSQIFPGTTTESADDALVFFKTQPEIAEFHLLDVFSPKGFLEALGHVLAVSQKLRFLEVSFTSRPDEEFLERVNAGELSELLGEKLVGLTLSIAIDTETEEEEDVQLVSGDAARGISEKVGKAGGLVMLDLTMFELNPEIEEVEKMEKILDGNPSLKVLGFAVRG